jgi:hypothetical protein
MTDLLLNMQGILLTIGLPSIDESLDKLLVAMETFPKSAILGDTVAYARILGLCLALCVGTAPRLNIANRVGFIGGYQSCWFVW